MAPDQSLTGYEEVFTVTDYYDGPRQGIAEYGGSPHFYDRVFSDEKQDFTGLYRLTSVSFQLFQLALEDWAIWKRWEHAFASGRTSLETHPALPEDAARHAAIGLILADQLRTDPSRSIVRAANFTSKKRAEISGVLVDLLVKWTEPSGTPDDHILLDANEKSGQSNRSD